MGTRVELHQFGPGDPDALAAARRAIEAVDDALTIHRPSPATVLNEALAAGEGAGIDDPILLDALVQVHAAWASTAGLFDPTVGEGDGGHWAAITIDPANARIEVARPLSLDFGGFGKGYALDLAGRALRDGGVVSALMSAGESSIAVIGEHPLGGGWPFAIPDPTGNGVLLEIEVVDRALSISSTAGGGVAAPERAATIRPGDGAPVTTPRIAVAIDRSGAQAEMMSTALLVADDDQARLLIADRPDDRFRLTPAHNFDNKVAA
jgi:FAD:protein FMN transferase